MSEAVTIGAATLHHGDCLEVMAGLGPARQESLALEVGK